MKIFRKGKDGGSESRVWGYWLIEIKSLFSVALLRFEDGSREAYHTHAFNSISWVLRGGLFEHFLDKPDAWPTVHKAGFKPIITRRDDFHKVSSVGRTWVLTFRGPWNRQWKEYLPQENRYVTLENGRKIANDN